MKIETLAIIGAAAVGAWALAIKAPGKAAAGNASNAGTDHLYGTNTQQTALTDAAIAANWQATFGGLNSSQPDWWI